MSTQQKNATAAVSSKKPETALSIVPGTAKEVKPISKSAIEEKLDLLNQQFSMVEQRDKLTDTLDDLKKFDLSSDNTRDCLSLDDGKGHKFTTFQPEVVKEAVALVRKHAEERLNRIDSILLAA